MGTELIRFLEEEWRKIPSEYDPKFIQSMRRPLQAVIDAHGGHHKKNFFFNLHKS